MTIDSLWFELIDLSSDSVVHKQEAFSYDFELDVYGTEISTYKILKTIYSTTFEWQTLGNYDVRRFYQQVSRSNGDGIINDQDDDVYFNSSNFPDGNYL